MMMKQKKYSVLNYTPHEIVIFNDDDRIIKRIKPTGKAIRVNQENKRIGYIDIDGVAVPESSVTFIDNGLPEEKEGVYIIVSKLTADAFPLRNDLLLVNEMVRDENGAIVGCRSLPQANKKYKFKNYN